MHETFVFYYNPKLEIETITRKFENNDENYFIIGHFLTDQNNSKLIFFDVKPIEFKLAYILLPQFPIWLLLQSAVERGIPEY